MTLPIEAARLCSRADILARRLVSLSAQNLAYEFQPPNRRSKIGFIRRSEFIVIILPGNASSTAMLNGRP